nr:MAG TPA: hypothetical protein [Caudoviricetes sp.]
MEYQWTDSSYSKNKLKQTFMGGEIHPFVIYKI